MAGIVLWVVRNLPYIIGTLVIIAGLWWVYDKIYDSGYDKAKQKYEAKIAKIESDSAEVLRNREAELKTHIEEGRIRYEDAEKNYSNAMLELANTPKSSSLPIRTKNCSSGNTLPGNQDKNEQRKDGATGQTFEARLPERNTELLNSAMTAIRQLQAECQYVRDRAEFTTK